MTIDPRLYKKYTGKSPGEAMTRLGQSLAQQSARQSAGDTSVLGAIGRGRRRVAIVGGVIVAGGGTYGLGEGGV